jgi:hypothetical protein
LVIFDEDEILPVFINLVICNLGTMEIYSMGGKEKNTQKKEEHKINFNKLVRACEEIRNGYEKRKKVKLSM